MTFKDLNRLVTGPTLFRLDAILAPKLIPILYALGLAALFVWAITHLFASFGAGFGHGLWGLLEIAVFGLLMFIVLRIGCEALMVYFRDRDTERPASRSTASLLDEVRDAIRELAEDDEIDGDDYSEVGEYETRPQRPVGPAAPGERPAPVAPVTPPPGPTPAPPAAGGPVIPEEPAAPPASPTMPEEPGERGPATTPGATHSVPGTSGDEPQRNT